MAFALGPTALRLGYRLAAFDEIGSTNAEALARARDREAGPLWLVTAHQTAGRGRRTRPWISPPGNLACTVIEMLQAERAQAATLGFAAGLASHLVHESKLAGAVTAFAERLAKGGARAIAATKRWLNELDGSLDDALAERGARISAELIAGDEAQARIQKLFGAAR